MGDFVLSKLSADELDALCQGELRCELVEGLLVVGPLPALSHQDAVFELAVLLRAGCPAELKTYVSRLEYRPDDRNSLQPDVAVVRRAGLGVERLVDAPVLIAEVLSARTRRQDLKMKPLIYARHGVEHFWTVDPDVPSVRMFELVDGEYVLRAEVEGAERTTVERPFPVEVCPQNLLNA